MIGKKHGYDVFLGGTTNKSTWRAEFLKLINDTNSKIKCFNPVVENWTQECIDIENFVKHHAKYHIYVLTPRMMGVYTIAEMCESAHNHTKKTYFHIKDEDCDDNGNTIYWEPHMKNSLNATSNMLISHGAYKMNSIDELVNAIVNDYNNAPNPRLFLNK